MVANEIECHTKHGDKDYSSVIIQKQYIFPEKLYLYFWLFEMLGGSHCFFSNWTRESGQLKVNCVSVAFHIQSLVLGEGGNKSRKGELKERDGHRNCLASLRWAAASQHALAISLASSYADLQKMEIEDENNVIARTKDAVLTLQCVLEGKHNEVIAETLNQLHVSQESWWSALYRVIEGTFRMSCCYSMLHIIWNFAVQL